MDCKKFLIRKGSEGDKERIVRIRECFGMGGGEMRLLSSGIAMGGRMLLSFGHPNQLLKTLLLILLDQQLRFSLT